MYKEEMNVFAKNFNIRKVLMTEFLSKQEYKDYIIPRVMNYSINDPSMKDCKFVWNNNTITISSSTNISEEDVLKILGVMNTFIIDFFTEYKEDIMYALSNIDSNPNDLYATMIKYPATLYNTTHTFNTVFIQF